MTMKLEDIQNHERKRQRYLQVRKWVRVLLVVLGVAYVGVAVWVNLNRN